MVMESKYKQTNEKMNMLTERINELEIKLHSAEESYAKMKGLFKASKDECLNQKFEIEELKEQIRSMKMNESIMSYPKDDDTLLSQDISSIIELGIILKEKESFLKQVAEYHEMNVSLI
jgi:predicted  nucleic acid-binding Zn-ribbon protein